MKALIRHVTVYRVTMLPWLPEASEPEPECNDSPSSVKLMEEAERESPASLRVS